MAKKISGGAKQASGGKGTDAAVVTNTEETWHLAQLSAYRDVADRLTKMLEASGGPETALHRRLRRMITDIHGRIRTQYCDYVAVVSPNELERSAMLKIGAPDMVELNMKERVVTAEWAEAPGDSDLVGVFEVQTEADNTDQTFSLTTPFREIRVDRMPEGTKKITINDPRHAATAALSEIFDMITRDITEFSKDLAPEQVWQRMAYQVTFYKKAVRLQSKSLPNDEYRTWEPQMPARMDIEMAPQIIANTAGTSRAQQILALYMAARYYGDLMSSCERDASDLDEAAWVAQTCKTLGKANALLQEVIVGYNSALMAMNHIKDDGSTCINVMKPMPRGLPVLAVIPSGHDIAKFPGK